MNAICIILATIGIGYLLGGDETHKTHTRHEY